MSLSGLLAAFFIAGLLAHHYYKNDGLVRRRTFWIWIVVASIVSALLMTAGILVANSYDPTLLELNSEGSATIATVAPSLVFGIFVASVLICLIFLVFAFGGIGVMAAIGRRAVPWILQRISDSNPRAEKSLETRIIRWMFNVPDVLDARTLSVSTPPRSESLNWSLIRGAIMWQLFVGAILAIYVSFNPFISNRSPAALVGIFTILTSSSVLIPLIILPWYVFRGLDARIKGVIKDFTLFDGIRSRLFESFLAIGTIFILIRLAISTIDLQTYLLVFSAFMVVLLAVALAFTLVFFNYFERQLIEDISSGFSRLREGETPHP